MATKVVVHLTDGHARAVGDAVVMLTPDSAVAAAPATQSPATYIIDQRDETFTPYVQLLRPGDKVIFRNSDITRHHAYSFAPIMTFELVLQPGESSPAMRMDKAGIAAIGCNIHDHMVTYLFVSALPTIAMSNRKGVAVIAGLAPGRYTAKVWHPQLRPGQAPPERTLVVKDDALDQQLDFTLLLVPDPRAIMARGQLNY